MAESELWGLSILGLLVIGVLLVIIRKQVLGLRAQTATAQQASSQQVASELAVDASSSTEAASPTQPKSHKLDLADSIQVIATLTLDDQVELSEAAIRLKVLLDHFDSTMHEQPAYAVFAKVYAELEHMPTHEARKQTDKRILHKLDQQRFAIEARYREEIREGASALLEKLGK